MASADDARPQAESEKLCFVVSPISTPGSDVRRRADQVLRHVIRPAVVDLGYTAVRADEINETGMITHQVLQRVVSAELARIVQ